MTASLRLAVVGATGRMGSAVLRLAAARGMKVTRAFGRPGCRFVGEDIGLVTGAGPMGVLLEEDVTALGRGDVDVAIDFSSADAFSAVTSSAAAAGVPLVSGTTGLTPEGESALEVASRRVPLLWEPNLSVGVHVLGRLLAEAIAALHVDGVDAFDVEIVETHHRKKVDAPSGTALRLAAIAETAAGGILERRHGREGKPGERSHREIGVHAVRGGDVIGDHSVHLLGPGERIELVHRATSRDLFAHGALRAAAWLAGKPAGRYRMADVLGGGGGDGS